MENEIAITDAKDVNRYEARDAAGNLMGFVDYKLAGEVISFRHAETLPEYQGQGVASKIARKSLDDARDAGLRIRPACPYYQDFLKKHTEYADLVDDSQ
ncbi:GNAT family N-acetyltransferase [Streptomyces sp. SID13031]|uniref:GNAT family N-acetyltransferase n=1 Tax=Streptomyces sp. SID13031 TaxID=2706046 RepID=UPI0013CD3924|nr:GNAT family N-acetyltransferase [Streptomyces sp. SID13031]NEA32751.1 N-acetyltransferase [Streptomyces sp. SID13031]